jgi:RimJ/RimL family protein N-acetyltransferase
MAERATPPPEEQRVAFPPREEIELAELTLRRWRPDWADALQRAVEASLPQLRPFMVWATEDHDLEASRAYIARSVAEWDAGESFNFALVASDGSIIGSAGLMTRMGAGVLEIGYWVHSAYTGRGYATAVAAALAEAGLALPGVARVAIKHDRANAASGRVAEKAGFVRVGEAASEDAAPGATGVDWIWERHR